MRQKVCFILQWRRRRIFSDAVRQACPYNMQTLPCKGREVTVECEMDEASWCL